MINLGFLPSSNHFYPPRGRFGRERLRPAERSGSMRLRYHEVRMVTTTFAGFRQAFDADPDLRFPIDADETADSLSMTLGIYVPGQLVEFWREVGGGYFGNRTLYVFGGEAHSRDTVMHWNTR